MPQNFPTVLNIAFSLFGIWLVAISLGIFSRAPTKLVQTASACFLMFPWRSKSLELLSLPFC